MSLTIPKALEGNFKPIVYVGQSMDSPFFPLCLPPSSPLEGGPREVMPSTAWPGPDSWTPAQPRGSAMSPAKATITRPQHRNPQTWHTAGVVGGGRCSSDSKTLQPHPDSAHSTAQMHSSPSNASFQMEKPSLQTLWLLCKFWKWKFYPVRSSSLFGLQRPNINYINSNCT